MKKRKKIIILGVVLISFLVLFNFSEANWNLSNISSFGLPAGTVSEIILAIVSWLLMIFSAIAVGAFIVSGIMYLISTGNDEMVTKAKKYMTYSIVGVVVGLSGYVIIQALNTALNATSPF